MDSPPQQNSESASDFVFPNYDSSKKVNVPHILVSNGHLAVRQQVVNLPRDITDKDKSVKFLPKDVEFMFINHYNDYFGIDFKKQFGKDPTKLKYKRVRRALVEYWRTESKVQKQAEIQLKKDLIENNSVLKLTDCLYADEPDPVSIYYNLNSDLFGIVSQKTNKFIHGGVASMCDYIDVHYFKCLGEEKTFNAALEGYYLKDPKLLEGPKEFYKWRDFGLPLNYNPEKWWEVRQEELVELFLSKINKSPDWYEALKLFESKFD